MIKEVHKFTEEPKLVKSEEFIIESIPSKLLEKEEKISEQLKEKPRINIEYVKNDDFIIKSISKKLEKEEKPQIKEDKEIIKPKEDKEIIKPKKKQKIN